MALGPAYRVTGERSASKPVTIPCSSIESATWARSGGVVMLADLQDLYEPAPFNHKGHAEMAEMSAGCTVCHHHTPVGQEHPACRSCHEKTAVREDIAMPGLKGAYHRQCMSCHREWSHDTACNACHVAKPQRGATLPWQAGGGELARRKPAIRIEDTYVYQTPHLESPVVTFHHEDHSKAFGVACVQCHGGESCSSCHDGTAGRPLARANRNRAREGQVHHLPPGDEVQLLSRSGAAAAIRSCDECRMGAGISSLEGRVPRVPRAGDGLHGPVQGLS